MTTPGLKVDQVAPAFINVPGITVEMLNIAPTATRSTTSTSFVGIGVPAISEPGEIIQTFVAPVAGTYLIMFHNYCYHSGGNWGQFRVVFDYDTTPIYVGDNAWYVGYSGASFVIPGDFFATVNLAAGVHKVKTEWRAVGGTLSTHPGLFNWKIQGTLVSGSGAGGVIAAREVASGVSVTSVQPIWQDAITVTTTTSSEERVLISHTGTGQLTTVGNTSCMLRVLVDGFVFTSLTVAMADQWETNALSGSWVSDALTAGSHTIKIQLAKYAVGDQNWTYNSGSLSVLQFRGGLVPIQQDGAQVIDKPQAINFTGPGCQIANIGGTATVSIAGAEGAVIQKGTLASLTTVSGTESPAARQLLSDLTLTFSAVYGERVQVHFAGWGYMDTAGVSNLYITPYLDDVPLNVIASRVTVQYVSQNLSFGFVTDALSAGPHTLKFYASKYDATDQNWKLVNGTKTWIVQHRGGYTHPENIPILEYSSASVVNVKAGPGASSELRLLLNDGTRYRATSPLTVDLTVSGRGGIDTGSEAVSTWYYVYAVPATTAGYFSVLCSVTGPATGPTGYSTWRYLGAFRNDASSNIIKFNQVNAEFSYFDSQEPAFSAALGTTPVEPAANKSIADVVPITAKTAKLWHRITRSASPEGCIIQQIYAKGATQISGYVMAPPGGTAYLAMGNSNCEVPLSDQSIEYRCHITLGSPTITAQTVRVTGWVDGYLSGATQAQAQAPFTADTKSPKGTRLTATTVGFGARPGQSSTTRLTLQSGKQRTMTTGAWAVANGVADWGYDEAASQGNTKWLYFYAVPKSGDDSQLVIRASDNAPSTGPTGYADFKLVWADYVDGSGNLKEIVQTGNRFSYLVGESVYNVSTYTPDGSPVSTSLTTHIPESAGKATLGSTLYGPTDPPDDSQWVMRLFWDSGGIKQLWGTVVTGESGIYRNVSREQVDLPIPSDRTLYRQLVRVLGTATSADLAHAEVYAWIDEWIDP